MATTPSPSDTTTGMYGTVDQYRCMVIQYNVLAIAVHPEVSIYTFVVAILRYKGFRLWCLMVNKQTRM